MSKTTTNAQARLQNDYGADLWVRSGAEHRHSTSGRGLFAGLQDVKHYNVEDGWARRNSEPSSTGLFGFLWGRMTGGSYKPPTER